MYTYGVTRSDNVKSQGELNLSGTSSNCCIQAVRFETVREEKTVIFVRQSCMVEKRGNFHNSLIFLKQHKLHINQMVETETNVQIFIETSGELFLIFCILTIVLTIIVTVTIVLCELLVEKIFQQNNNNLTKFKSVTEV